MQTDKILAQLTLLFQLVKGQNYLTIKVNPHQTGECRFYKKNEETFLHIISECPVFTELLLQMFQTRHLALLNIKIGNHAN